MLKKLFPWLFNDTTVPASGKDTVELVLHFLPSLFVNSAEAEAQGSNIARRIKDCNSWITVAPSRSGKLRYVTGDFTAGVVFGPVFNSNAPPVDCAVDYKSTGEAEGLIYTGELSPTDPTSLFGRVVKLAYDQKNRRFYNPDRTFETLKEADVLILAADGSAHVCWINPEPAVID